MVHRRFWLKLLGRTWKERSVVWLAGYTFVQGQPAPTLVDPGRGHVHIIRNEGSVVASSIAVQLVPYDPSKSNRRIDAPAPENCPNIQ